MKIRLREVNVLALNTRTVILLTQFVRLARLREGADLKMQQQDIVYRIFQYAAESKNPDLIVLFMHIKKALSAHVRRNKLEGLSFNVYDNSIA